MMKFFLLVILTASLVFGQAQADGKYTYLEKIKSTNSFVLLSLNNELNFELGINDELILMLANEFNTHDGKFKNTIKFLLPYNFHITAGVRFLRYYKIDYRFGILAAQDYVLGIDEGLYFQAGLPNSKIYGVIGVDFFNNNLASDGITETGGNFTFYSFGLGYEASENFSVDIMYSFPGGNKIYAREPAGLYGDAPGLFYYKKINGLIRLGFQYSFIF
jgi:hypothetical protein